MPSAITITGDKDTMALLARYGVRGLHLTAPMEASARFAERQIRGIPEDTGRLARSVRGGGDQYRDVDSGGFQLGTNVRYGRFVFHGTKHMRAQPPRVNTNAIARQAGQQIGRHLQHG